MPPRSLLLYALLLFSAAMCLILLNNKVKNYMMSEGRCNFQSVDVEFSNQNNKARGTDCLPPLVKRLKKCLLWSLAPTTAGQFWSSLTPAIEDCCRFLSKTLPIHTLYNMDDFKFAILPIAGKVKCVTLTIGIGNDIGAEKELKKLIPNCQFIGTDPIVESGKIYDNIGRYLNIAVSDSNGTIEASVLANGTYQSRNVTAQNFNDLLVELKEPVIDFLFLDAEGAEYQIMPLLTNERRYLNSVVCQISVEIHGYSSEYRMNDVDYKAQVLDLIANSSFLPIYGTKAGFNRMYWLNMESPACLEKYFADFCDYS
uniref:Methyltransferase FkbM domain-containing protein n=1 Tax=Romanomermis culicivorax TaxID=13658 RepID=A0A915KRT0_ROMCU